jgi:hypothetical protein
MEDKVRNNKIRWNDRNLNMELTEIAQGNGNKR